jgi:DNA-binding MarR family transcriptional regulator
MPTRRALPLAASPAPQATLIDLERYVPAYLTWIANKLSRGASQHYLNAFGVGMETWRCLVLLAVEESISAQQVSKFIGMDKASVSRCFKGMQANGLIVLELVDSDGRLRLAKLTKKGRALHDQIIGVALERERAFLAVLTPQERDKLTDMLKRLHENLPQVESATQHDAALEYPRAATRRVVAPKQSGDK